MKFRLTEWLLFVMAQLLASCRALSPYPGWYFGVSEKRPTFSTKIRLAIWDYCNKKKMERAIVNPWYNGLKVFSYLGNDSSRLLFIGGCYEPNEFFFLSSILKPGMVFVDVGANEGLYSLFASTLVQSKGRVISIEPSASIVYRLEKNIELNGLGNITVIRCAASSYSGVEKLSIAEYGHEGQNTLAIKIHNPLVSAKNMETVEVRPLDKMLNEAGIKHVDFIKVDAEGTELHVLKGAAETIQRDRPFLQLEINDEALSNQQHSSEEIKHLLHSWGYDIYKFGPTGKLVPSDESLETDSNVIAVPEDRPEPVESRVH